MSKHTVSIYKNLTMAFNLFIAKHNPTDGVAPYRRRTRSRKRTRCSARRIANILKTIGRNQ